MSTYNGEKFLREQIDSLLAQTYPVEIYVRDDGSTDSTQSILDEYRKNKCLEWYTGENLKPAKSFWNLVQTAPQADYYAFCDQDDVWFPDKIERAIQRLTQEENRNRPLLYCSNVTVTDADLKPISKMIEGEVYTDFAHSLIYSLAPGCTMVFNAQARTEMIKYDMNKEFEIIHDRLTHKIIAMLGKVIFDYESTMYYRQHGNNAIGSSHGFFSKCRNVMFMRVHHKSLSAKALYSVYCNSISEECRDLLKMVGFYQDDKKWYKKFIKDKRFNTVNRKNCALKWLIRLKRI